MYSGYARRCFTPWLAPLMRGQTSPLLAAWADLSLLAPLFGGRLSSSPHAPLFPLTPLSSPSPPPLMHLFVPSLLTPLLLPSTPFPPNTLPPPPCPSLVGGDCSYDWVEIGPTRKGDKPMKICGGGILPPPFVSLKSAVWIKFHSDSSRGGRGFAIDYISGNSGRGFAIDFNSGNKGRRFAID